MLSTLELVNTGVLMGILHVLTGPDHLSALATLSGTDIYIHAKEHQHTHKCLPCYSSSFVLGIKWGLGHSLGLLVVGGLLIWWEEEAGEDEWMSDKRGNAFSWFVGVFMLLLGVYGLRKAFRNRSDSAILPDDVNATPRESLVDRESLLEDSDNEDQCEMLAVQGVNVKGRNRRSSMELIEEMASALNRDGDSIRGAGGDSTNPSVNPSMKVESMGHLEIDDLESRIYNAAESLRQNSGVGNERDSGSGSDGLDWGSDRAGDDDQFDTSLRKSAGHLSRSFVRILNRNGSAPPRASQFLHTVSKNSIAAEKPPPRNIRGGLLRKCACCVHPGSLAILAGIVHGIAGPGGVLGVIPAVQLKDPQLAIIYLSTFCTTSTLVMGGFAACYGRFSEWLAGGVDRRGGSGGSGANGAPSRVFVVELGSALLSVGVGVVWMVLLTMGKLQDAF